MVGRRLEPALLLLLVSATLSGCGGSGIEGGREGAPDAATAQGSPAPGEDRPATETAREPAGLKPHAVSSGRAYVLAGFGDGSLWATDVFACNDTGTAGSSASSAACAVTSGYDTPLRRLDPQDGSEEAEIPLKNFFANITEVAYGSGFVWACAADYYPGPPEDSKDAPGGTVFKIDPETNRVVGRIPVLSSSGLAFGHGSLWVTSAGHGVLSRVEPETGRVTAEIEVGRGAVDVAVDGASGAVWVAGLHLSDSYDASAAPADPADNKLTRVDPTTNRVVAEIPIAARSRYGGAQNVAAGEGAVWAGSGDGKLFKVDPAKNEVVAVAPLGDYFSDLKVSEDAVWATVQDAGAAETRLVRVEPRADGLVASGETGPVDTRGYGSLAAGGGYVWFASAAGETGKGALARVAPAADRR